MDNWIGVLQKQEGVGGSIGLLILIIPEQHIF